MMSSLSLASYSAEPLLNEMRFSQAPSPFPEITLAPRGAEFVKDSRRGSVRLRLSGQAHDNVAVPVFGIRVPVEGTVELLKPEGLSFVVVRVEGLLKVKEVAEGGTTTTVLCDETLTLWRKDVDLRPCPFRLPFSIALPTEFRDEHGTWQALPPTFEAHLSGLPGFTAEVDYTVTAVASKTKTARLGIGATSVSTPFIFYPRGRPARRLPPRLESTNASPGLVMSPDWRVQETPIAARVPGSSSKSIVCKFYTPASHVLCMRQAIPYHITFTGPGQALATLLTYMPSRMGAAPVRACSRIQLLRQTSVDVNEYAPVGATSEIWHTRAIGEGSLYRTGDGTDWLSFSGEIKVDSQVTIGGFRAAGLWVKDYIVFSISPPDPLKGPIGDMRCVIPVRLVTDPAWGSDAVSSDARSAQASPTPSETDDSLYSVMTTTSRPTSVGDVSSQERYSYLASENAE